MMPAVYNAALTREQFLFPETRIVARLMDAGRTDEEIYRAVAEENLFQLPTEKSVRSLVRPCLRRLHGLADAAAVHAIAAAPAATARQLVLYALMRDSRLVAQFLVTVVGEKYRTHDPRLSRADVRVFFLHLAEQSDQVAGWSEATVKKLISVLMHVLVQSGYLAGPRARTLAPVRLAPCVRDAIARHHDEWLLPAFQAE